MKIITQKFITCFITLCISISSFAGAIEHTNKATSNSCPTITVTVTSQTNEMCYGNCEGSAIVSASGGAGPYSYMWSNNILSSGAGGLCAGSYTVTAIDMNGCEGSATVNITEPPQLGVNPYSYATTCSYSCDGSMTFVPYGGTAPYSYSYNVAGTSSTISNLCAGSYTAIVTDAHGCIDSLTQLAVLAPPAIVITPTVTQPLCGKANGEICVNASGGSPGYNYAWSMGPTSPCVNNLLSGTYCVTVTDASGCKDTSCVNLPNHGLDTAEIVSVTNVTCNGGANGIIKGGVKGTYIPYTFTWSPGPSSLTATGLSAGTYTLTVTDSAGCMSTAIATVTQPTLVTAHAYATPKAICQGSNTPVTLSAIDSGGNGAYGYNWFPNSSLTVSTGQSVSAMPNATTTYTLLSADDNNCAAAPVSVTVLVDPPPVTSFSISPASPTIQNPTIYFTDLSTDMYGISSWFWNFGNPAHTTSKQQNPHFTYADTGIYCPMLVVTNIGGCVDSVTQCFNIGPDGINEVHNNSSFSIYPVPATNKLNITTTNFLPEQTTVYDLAGRELIHENINTKENIITLNISQLDNGVYILMLADGNTKRQVKFIVSR